MLIGKTGRIDVEAFRNGGYNSHMEKASVSGLKDRLSFYLRKVRAGHSILIVDRNVPIARLERVESAGRGEERIAKLIADGTLRPSKRRLTAKELRAALSVGAAGAGVLDALLAHRADDR